MRTLFRRLSPAVLLLFALIAASGCGGGGNDQNATALLDSAFKQSVRSADLNLDGQLQINSSSSLGRQLRVKATGPFQSNKGKLPSFDIDVSAAAGPGQTFEIGFVSTGDRAFTKFQDVYYEQSQSKLDQALSSLNNGNGKQRSLRSLGVDPRRWLKDAHTEGDQKVAGAETTQVSGKLNVDRVLRDLNGFVKRSGSAIGSATGQAPQPLSDSSLKKFEAQVKDPSFDVYVAKSDHTIRRLAGHVDFKGGSLSFTIELSKVNRKQTIQAPARAHPISELTGALGSGILGGSSSSGGSGGSTTPTPSSPSSDAYKKYGDCLDKAKPQDTDALQRCANLLH